MKTKLLSLILFASFYASAQIVNIPDANFKNILLDNNSNVTIEALNSLDEPIVIDANGDNEIQQSEAAQIFKLNISASLTIVFINNISGLESFTNLKEFYASGIRITNINLTSGLPNLESFTYEQQSVNTTFVTVSNLPKIKDFTIQNVYQMELTLTNLPKLENLLIWKVSAVSLNNLPELRMIEFEPTVTFNVLDFSGFTNLRGITLKGKAAKIINCSGLVNLMGIQVESAFVENVIIPNAPELNQFYCICNNLNQLQTGAFPKLVEYWVQSNFLDSVDLSGSPLLDKLHLSLSAATFINLKNGRTVYSDLEILDTSAVQTYICVDEGEIFPEGQVSIQGMIGNYCSFTPGGSYNTIAGTTTFDADNNGCGTGADIVENNIRMKLTAGTLSAYAFTNALSQYKFYTQAGNFTITPEFENNWFTATPSTASINFANNNNNISTNNFCITSSGSHPDVEVVVYPITNAQPGFDATYKIVYKNKGNQTLSGAVTFNYDDATLDFVSATPAQSAASTGQLTFNYTNLLPFEDRSIEVTLNLNGPMETPPLNNGDDLDFSVAITPTVGDETPLDNTFALEQEIVGSYDPNDIVCLEGDVVSPTQIGDYLHYVVNFENTGTAPTSFIVVRVDVNPAQYDISTLRVLNTSHAADIRVTGNKIEFIMATATLAAGDHGNILFKMKSKSNLVEGNTVKKKASIFFDYNFPIVTNDANTTFQALSTGNWAKDDSVKVYPNPSAGMVKIEASSAINSIELYDVQGRVLEVQKSGEVNLSLDIAKRAKGIYFVKVITEKGAKVEKIVRE